MSGAPLALRKRGRRRGFALAIGVRLWLMSQRDSGARNIPEETTRSSGPLWYSAMPDPIGHRPVARYKRKPQRPGAGAMLR
jgi:hypothetical protein